MTALNAIPLHIQGILAFLGGTYFLYLFFKANAAGKVGVFAFVLWLYGMALVGGLSYFQVDQSITDVVFFGTLIVAAILFVLGVFISYRKTDEEGRLKWKATGRVLLKGFLYILAFFIVMGVLMRLGIV